MEKTLYTNYFAGAEGIGDWWETVTLFLIKARTLAPMLKLNDLIKSLLTFNLDHIMNLLYLVSWLAEFLVKDINAGSTKLQNKVEVLWEPASLHLSFR